MLYLTYILLIFLHLSFFILLNPSYFPQPNTNFLKQSTGIIVIDNNTVTIQHFAPNGIQLNIFPIHVNSGNGISAAFTIMICTNMMIKNTFKKSGFSFNRLKIPNLSSLTLNPLNNALKINNTKYAVKCSASLSNI